MSDNSKKDVLDRLINILDNPEKRILPLLYSNGTPNDNDDHDDGTSNNNNNNKESVREKQRTLEELIKISKTLFFDIESLGKQYKELHENNSKVSTEEEKNKSTMTTSISSVLSGLPKLHVPEMKVTDTDLPETIFGQVDLQNSALVKLVKKSSKRLVKSSKDDICILDLGVMDSEDDVDNDDSDGDNDEYDESNDEQQDDDDGSDNENDEEAQRIRERMERAMEDMDEEEEESNDEDAEDTKGGKKAKSEEKQKEELYDPVVEDMKDGFFDLNEMEEFADEEEDYLPSEAFGQPEEKKNKKQDKNKKSFHQRQREGGMDHDNSDEEESDEDELFEEVKSVKRKKYRDKEDIDALYDLYEEKDPDDEDEDDDDGVVDMTAADLFGAPQKQFIERYKKKNPQSNKKSSKKDDDDDSWGEYDFDKEDKTGWRDDRSEDQSQDDNDDEEEMEDMKDAKEDDVAVPGRKNDKKKNLTKEEEKLRRQTDELEKELINEKPWQMKGESKSTSRPTNSLLEGTPEFEMASKQAPIITVEHTIDLEDAIKKRIIAEDWDDVVPRELPDIGWNKKRGEAPEVSQEKSKLGLGELYEREYLKKAVGYDKDADEKKTEEDKAKDEMKQLFANLCSKLDALSNYHFAPRPIADEAEARPMTVPAIAMEEVLPLHVSDARGIAPEEVYAPKRGRDGILRADDEMDQTDRKRQRNSKKTARRKARKEKEADNKLISRLQPGLGLNNPYEKRKAQEELSLARARGKVTMGERDMTDTKFGSSGTFFKRLQAEAQETVHGHAKELNDDGPEKKSKSKSSAYKL